VTGAENQAVEQKVGGAGRLMEIDIPASSVVRRQVEDHTHTGHGPLGHARTPQVGFSELHAATLEVGLNVLELPAAQIIDHSNASAPFEQRFHQVGTDKRCSTRNQNATSYPIHFLLPDEFRLVLPAHGSTCVG
jgi:hypothetical protein